MVNLIAWMIFAGVCVLCVFLYIKQRGFHPEMFELAEGEEIIKMAKGDYWTDNDDDGKEETQNPGEFAFTNKALLFQGSSIVSDGESVEIEYNEIKKVEKAYVGYILPVAFVITTKDDEKYKFAIMKRDIYIDLINSYISK